MQRITVDVSVVNDLQILRSGKQWLWKLGLKPGKWVIEESQPFNWLLNTQKYCCLHWWSASVFCDVKAVRP